VKKAFTMATKTNTLQLTKRITLRHILRTSLILHG